MVGVGEAVAPGLAGVAAAAEAGETQPLRARRGCTVQSPGSFQSRRLLLLLVAVRPRQLPFQQLRPFPSRLQLAKKLCPLLFFRSSSALCRSCFFASTWASRSAASSSSLRNSSSSGSTWVSSSSGPGSAATLAAVASFAARQAFSSAA